MSAYLVTRETINCCCQAMTDNGSLGPSCEQLDELGRRLWRMNADAVAQRYSEAPEPTSDFNYRPARYSKIQQYKALQCLRYQCSEGNIPELALYKQVEDCLHKMAAEIVCDLPEYSAAGWGLPEYVPPSQRQAAAGNPNY